MTDISSNTIISNTSILFVFCLGYCFLKTEVFNWIKIVGVIVSFAGACLVTLADPSTKEGESFFTLKHILGDGFALVSAFSYGVYATFLKRRIPKAREKYFKMSLFLGFVGLTNIIFLLPLFPILHFTKAETFEWPNGKTVGFLTLNALIGTCVSDFCWAKSVILLGPLITQLGISLTIPLSMLAS
jgi:solute carrier family 35 protein F5